MSDEEKRPEKTGLTKEELLDLLEASEEREREHEERWEKLREKVETTTESVRGRFLRLREELLETVTDLQGIVDIASKEQQEASAGALLKADEVRRAYAIFDALRSVGIWMKGFC